MASRRTAWLDGPFLGVEALERGEVRKHELRGRYSAIFPGVYLPRGVQPAFRQRAEAAWLWSHRRGVLCGLTAARLHGAKWIDDTIPIELNWSNGRPPAGIRVHKDRLSDGDSGLRASLPVTTVQRTAFDIGRRGSRLEAVQRLDALGNAAGIAAAEIAAVASEHRGARGVRRLIRALDLYDAGAESPRETWLRLLVVDSGFPRPQTQVPVTVNGRVKYYLDMGWPELMLAIEYEGDHHRTDRERFARDIARLEELVSLGWTVIRVAADTRPEMAIASLRRAWNAAQPNPSRVR